MKRGTLALVAFGLFAWWFASKNKVDGRVGDDAKKKKDAAKDSGAISPVAPSSATAKPKTVAPWSAVVAQRDIPVPDHPGWIIPVGSHGTLTLDEGTEGKDVSWNIKGPWGDGTSFRVAPDDVSAA